VLLQAKSSLKSWRKSHSGRLYAAEIAKIYFFSGIHIDSSCSVGGALVLILMDLLGKEFWEGSWKRHPFRPRLGNLFLPAYSQLRAWELTVLTMVEETCSSHFHQYQMPKSHYCGTAGGMVSISIAPT
jgi:hypothetical protein